MSVFLSLTKKSLTWGCRTQCRILRSCSAFLGLWGCCWCRSLSQLSLFPGCLFCSSPWPHLFLVPELGWLLLSAGSLPRGGGHPWSHLQCHVALVVGSWKASGTGTSSPSCFQELGCEPALYRQRVPGRFQRCWSRDGHPSPSLSPSHPGSATPCTSSPRSHISELCHLHIPQRHIRAVPCPEGPGPAINQPGLPLPHPCATPGAPGCRIFPVHPPLPLAQRWMRSCSRVCSCAGHRAGAEREWLGTGHGGNEAPLCWHLLGFRGISWLQPWHPCAG